MAEKLFESSCNPTGPFKEAVCVDAARIYDSCGDKDCLENLDVFLQILHNQLLITHTT